MEQLADGIDVIDHLGNVVIRDWNGDNLVATHTLTPTKAHELIGQLKTAASNADAMMPKL